MLTVTLKVFPELRVLAHGLRLIDLVYALFFLGCAVEGQ
jgi:hypothetical protein